MKKTTLLLGMLAAAFVVNAQTSIIEKEASANPSEILYQNINPVMIMEEDHMDVENRNLGESATKELRKAESTMRTLSVPWNGGTICTTPHVYAETSGCCSYGIYDEIAGKNIGYRQPKHVFSSESEARNFAATVKASIPMFVPFRDRKVHPGNGWFYQNGGFHGAIDYSKEAGQYGPGIDPTFGVYAIADGKVVSVIWDDWLGNVVVIEHTASNGNKYRTAYMHLRNGFTHDLQKAKAAVVAGDAAPDSNPVKYRKYAYLPNPSTLLWGTNAPTIMVKKGDMVSAGKLIAYSGNTGQGGAGNGLNNNGTPANAYTANNHLHLMTVVPDPRPAYKNDWVQVDPYGVYAQVSNSDGTCYDILKDTPYARLFAPFYPSFNNVPLEYVTKYFNYYPGMGMALQTISLHRSGNNVLASGSFQYGLPNQWYARLYMTGADFQTYFNLYNQQGYRPREISVTPDANGVPRFSVIWKKKGNEGYYTYFNMTDADFQAKWNLHVVPGKMFIADHVSYSYNNVNLHAVTYVSSANAAFVEYHYMSSGTFNSEFTTLNNSGYELVGMNVGELFNGTYYGGIWRPKTTGYYMYYGMTPADYQTKFNTLTAQGYRLHKIQGYANSTRFAAIWVSSPITNLRSDEAEEEVSMERGKENVQFLKISPNPASERGAIEFNLEEGESGKIIIKDIMGIQSHEVGEGNFQAGDNRVEFSTDQLRTGLHIVEYVSKSRRKTSKLIIEKR